MTPYFNEYRCPHCDSNRIETSRVEGPVVNVNSERYEVPKSMRQLFCKRCRRYFPHGTVRRHEEDLPV